MSLQKEEQEAKEKKEKEEKEAKEKEGEKEEMSAELEKYAPGMPAIKVTLGIVSLSFPASSNRRRSHPALSLLPSLPHLSPLPTFPSSASLSRPSPRARARTRP